MNRQPHALTRSWLSGLFCITLVLLTALFAVPAEAAPDDEDVPLVIGHRTIHVFRASFGVFTPAERAEGARKRILRAFEQPGDGWTSVKSTPQGVEVALDGEPLFFVLPGDAQTLAGETAEDLANDASRVLQKAWSESREQRNAQASAEAVLKAVVATVLLIGGLFVVVKLSFRLRRGLLRWLAKRLKTTDEHPWGLRLAHLIPDLVARALIVLTWIFGLVAMFFYLSYTLGLFVITRPASETLLHSITRLTQQGLASMAQAVPGMFIAVLIFLLAWAATRLASEFFANIEARASEGALLNTHTAPATRRIVNTLIWLFAIAMAYPYLPGSHTEAFKGLSVIVGLMVSIGASGLVGQIASGVMIVYTYALKRGEYVRIQDYEGTVTELGLFVTRLRTGLGEEIALPNAYVLANVTRNFSRVPVEDSYVLDVAVTIGYDTPWRQVHALLLDAAGTIPEILKAPPAYVVQTALSDFYVAYKLIVHVDSALPSTRARVASDLHAAIQDAFNRHGVQIMSPHYLGDPQTPKVVSPEHWSPPPAQPQHPSS